MNNKLIQIGKLVTHLKAKREVLLANLDDREALLVEDFVILKNYELASAILLKVAKETQAQLAYHLSSLVTSCLSTVFEEPYEFEITYVEKRGKTEVDFALIRDGVSLEDPILSVGGGVVDVVSFALRIACLCLATPAPRKVLILDEPFRFVSRDLQAKVGLLLQELNEKLGIQFIIISHDKALVDQLEAKVITIEKGEIR